jgi:hypothetical protein
MEHRRVDRLDVDPAVLVRWLERERQLHDLARGNAALTAQADASSGHTLILGRPI